MRVVPLALLAFLLVACDTAGSDSALITSYDGPEITEADAIVTDEIGPRGWEATVFDTRAGRRISVRRIALCGDECSREVTISFRDEGRALPVSVQATVTTREALPERFEETPIDIARVEIQDWGPDVYSGVVSLLPQDRVSPPPIVFWSDDVVYLAE